MEEMEYECASVQFSPGDIIVMFTDGVFEAMNAAQEEFGQDRLRTIIKDSAQSSAADIVTQVIDAVHAFMGETPRRDDITLVTGKIT
jgi:sigma-B regulation protein RsbU (phosphoserine phosphatase)